MKITIENLQMAYDKVVAIENLDLVIGDRESVVLLGESGCGKTTTMRAIAGLETPKRGRITIGDRVVFDAEAGINVPAYKRNVGMVFQSYAVWPHMTVFQNVAYSLQRQKRAKKEIRERVMQTLEMVGLTAFASRGASELSGGQMQRVALARSVVMQPAALLLDEPLSNLDAKLRDRLRLDLRELQLQLGLTTVYVTHDQQEAFALADRIALMQGGRIVQIDKPSAMYTSPASSSIASFLGVSNVLPVDHTDDPTRFRIQGTSLSVDATGPIAEGTGNPMACIRSEHVKLSSAPTADSNSWPGTVLVSGFQGSSIRYSIGLTNDLKLDVLTSRDGDVEHPVGATVYANVNPARVQILREHAAAPLSTSAPALETTLAGATR